MDTLPKIRHFLWLCNHASIPTRQVIKYRGIDCFVLCPLCNVQKESIIHTLKDCPFARKFWLSIGVPQVLTNFLSLDLLVWLKNNCLCSINIQVVFPGASSFLLLFGGYGSIEIRLFLKTA